MPRLGTLVILLCLLVPGVAHAADGRVTVEVAGPAGSVTGPGSINCSATGGLCSDDESWPNTQQLPDSFTLTPQRPATGVTVTWTGCGEILSGDRCKGYYGDFRDGDGRGNVVRATFTDTMDPQVEITAPTVGDTQFNGNEDIVVKATATDNHRVAGVKFAIESKTVTDPEATNGVYEATFRSADFEHGFHDITATAVDASGNDAVSTRSIVVDKRPPSLEITGGVADNAFVADGPVSIDFTVGFDSTSIQCALARPDVLEPTWVGCSSINVTNGTHVATPLEDGRWTLWVRVADGEGNAVSAGRTFTLDRIAPAITLPGAPLGYAKQGVTTFLRPGVTETNLTLFECKAPGGNWQACNAGAEYADPNTAEGTRVWEFRATDAAGRVGSARIEWVVDGTAPEVTLSGLPAEGATVAPGRFLPEIEATDSSSGMDTVECGSSVDGPFEDCPEDAFELGEGEHTFVVRVEDRAGNALKVARRFTVKTPTTGGGDGDEDEPKNDGGDRPKNDGGGTTRDTPKNDPPAAQPAPAPAPVPAPPVATPRADRTAPVLTVSGPKKARSSALRKGLALTIGCSEVCKGAVSLAGPKGLKATAAVARAGKVRLKLGAAALKKALRGRKSAKLTLTVTVTDAAGNAATRKLTVTATP